MPGYIMITSYTIERHKAAIIEDVRKTSAEEVPMITFIAIDDLSDELGDWISETLK